MTERADIATLYFVGSSDCLEVFWMSLILSNLNQNILLEAKDIPLYLHNDIQIGNRHNAYWKKKDCKFTYFSHDKFVIETINLFAWLNCNWNIDSHENIHIQNKIKVPNKNVLTEVGTHNRDNENNYATTIVEVSKQL